MKTTTTAIFKHPLIAARGFVEFRSGFGLTWDDDQDKNDAYDAGREYAHRFTGRRFEI